MSAETRQPAAEVGLTYTARIARLVEKMRLCHDRALDVARLTAPKRPPGPEKVTYLEADTEHLGLYEGFEVMEKLVDEALRNLSDSLARL